MRTSAITVLGLAAAALLSLVSFNVKAAPITVDIQACTVANGNWCDSGSSTYSNSGVTFQGWEQIVSVLPGPADLTYKNGGANEVGLGVLCTYGTGDKCGEHEINTAPGQYISATIPAHISSLSIGVQSVDGGGGDNYNETASIYLSQCANVFECILGGNLPVPLDSYTFNGTNKTWTSNFTAAELSGYGYLYVTPLSGDAPDGNILLSSFSYQPVPEPAALGMLGLGVLLIGAFAGLRRRLG
ncbi:MAG TPA: PEP-CTERM sorting domain-containing protein [Rhodanobacteraceae bacterium]|nr:PEP-CTERM sorting domain-containing protein [Rhodanobacteraceae bacterium]